MNKIEALIAYGIIALFIVLAVVLSEIHYKPSLDIFTQQRLEIMKLEHAVNWPEPARANALRKVKAYEGWKVEKGK